MTRILGISGSLRAGSFNTALLRAAREVAGGDIEVDTATLHGIPLYDGDAEARDGEPAAVAALKQRIIASDGVLLVTPEYNNRMPGVFKNAIDWMSRPSTDIARVFGNKPFAITGASPGNFGTLLSQEAWLPIMRTLGTVPWFGAKLMVSRAGSVIADGKIVDEATEKKLRDFVAGFAAFVAHYTR